MSAETATLTPVFIAYLNGSRFSAELEAQVKEIVILDVLDGYSSFTIKISDPDRTFIDSEDLSVGSEIRIMLGFKDEVEDVMIGEITGIIPDFRKNQDPYILIKGYNRLYRLDSGKRTRSFIEMTPEDILVEIAGEAGLEHDIGIAGEAALFTMQKDQTNFEYAMQLAEYDSCRVWVTDNTLYVKKPEGNAAEDVILEWGKTLVDFHPKLNCRGLMNSVEVRGMDGQNAPVSGIATSGDITVKVGGDLMGADKVKDQFGENAAVVVDFTVPDENTAKQMAINYLTENSLKYITATGRCEGNNLIKAGSILEIKEVGERFNGKYLATSVKHRFVPGAGYETEFFLNRNTIVGKKGGGGSSGSSSAMAENKEEEKEEQGVLVPEFSNLAWKSEDDETLTEAMVGNVTYLTASAKHMRNGAPVTLAIWEKDKNNPDDFIKSIRAMVKDGKVSARWKYVYTEDTDDVESAGEQEEKGYTKPEYYFKISENVHNVESEQSPVLEFKDWVEVTFVNEFSGEPLKDVEYKLILPDGEEREGTLDENGCLKEENLPPGKSKIILGDDEYTVVEG